MLLTKDLGQSHENSLPLFSNLIPFIPPLNIPDILTSPLRYQHQRHPPSPQRLRD